MPTKKNRLKALARLLFLKNFQPHTIALGFSIGIFMALMPIFGFQMIPALAVAIKFKANKIATLLAVWITNPLTVIPIYYFCFWIGSSLMPMEYSRDVSQLKDFMNDISMQNFLALGTGTLLPLLIGCLILGSISAIAVYFPVKILISKYLERRKKKKSKSQTKAPAKKSL